MGFPVGDISGLEALTDADHLYASHINSLRQSLPASAVVGKTADCQYYCDGTDDDVQIQQALNDVDDAGGGKVFIKAGTYDLQNVLVVGDYTTMAGEGMGATVLKVGDHVWETLTTNPNLPEYSMAYLSGFILSKHDVWGNTHSISMTDYMKYVTFLDFTLDVNGQNQTFDFEGVNNYIGGGIKIFVGYMVNCVRVEVKNASWVGIAIYGAHSPNFDIPSPNKAINCHIDTAGVGQTMDDVTGGILFDGQACEGSIIAGNSIRNCTEHVNGIVVEDTEQVEIYGNTIYNCYYGIGIQSARRIHVHGNTINTTIDKAVYFFGDCSNFNFHNNYVLFAGTYGMMVPSLSAVKDNVFAYSGSNGVFINGAIAFDFSGNYIVDPGQDTEASNRCGILIDMTINGPYGAKIADNYIFDTYSWASNPLGVQSMQYGIRVIGTARTLTDVYLTGNHVQYAAIDDVDITGITWGSGCFAWGEGLTTVGFS